eukprot:TRINITY_DN1482_c0_g1_i1.p1 TRINITY_DN1482_c0_g1~~TRINITY_DN1482_c0_g1_i1.p1  ORF type:complete len:333 (+),score=42.70 TRINITY_DN1482_c0_g1_i1:33-1031(+)
MASPVPPLSPSPGPTHDLLTLSPGQQRAVIGVEMFSTFLSFLGCAFVLTAMVYFRRLSQRPARLVCAIVSAALVESVGTFLSFFMLGKEAEHPGMCSLQGFLAQFSQIAMFAWTLALTLDLYLFVVNGENLTKRKENVIHGSAFALSMIMALLPATTGAYGPAGVWCWITHANSGNMWRWVSFYIPIYVMAIAVITLLAIISYTVRVRFASDTSTSEQERAAAEALVTRLRLYPLIVLGLYVFPTINRIYDAAAPEDSFFLWILHALTGPLLGFCSAIVYGLDRPIRSRVSDLLYRNGFFMTWTSPLDEESGSDDEAVVFGDEEGIRLDPDY